MELEWIDILNNWAQGNYFKYPKRLKSNFEWNTNVLKKKGDIIFKEKFKTNKNLPIKQNYENFNEYIKKTENKYVISFFNPSKDTLLVIPVPRKNKNFSTIKSFSDNSSEIQKKEFWKEASNLIKKQMKKEQYLWVSSHGMGVPYFHLRICNQPKYYFDKNLSNT